ncbi:MAG: hypothetical protein DHS20C15_25290 [Planctomycetota bacterium]|nr:MAG: hypothetical protein DHS20C15_25290 [Planctomycetota bacterium]
MSTTPVLKAEARDTTGSAGSRRARANGSIPGNIYGHGQGNMNVLLNAHDLELALAGPSQLFTLQLSGGDESVLVKEVQYDTFGQRVLHVDFARIDLGEEVHVEVQVEYRGTPKGVAEGGDAITLHPTLSVKCRADSIPDVIIVDVSELAIGEQLHANELKLPAGVKIDPEHIDEGEPLFAVAAPKAEEPAEDAEGEDDAAADGDAPKAEGDKPKGDDGEG